MRNGVSGCVPSWFGSSKTPERPYGGPGFCCGVWRLLDQRDAIIRSTGQVIDTAFRAAHDDQDASSAIGGTGIDMDDLLALAPAQDVDRHPHDVAGIGCVILDQEVLAWLDTVSGAAKVLAAARRAAIGACRAGNWSR